MSIIMLSEQYENSGDLLRHGKIVLVRTPISGRYGARRLYSMLTASAFGFQWKRDDIQEELWMVTCTRSRKRLAILHIDSSGYDLTLRYCFTGTFQLKFEEILKAEVITRETLVSLIYDQTSSS